MPEKTERSYHFNCGDSSKGSIGFCARVSAPDKKTALKHLRDFLGANSEIDLSPALPDHIEYCRVYIEGANVHRSDIDSIGEARIRTGGPDSPDAMLDAEELYHRVCAFLKEDSDVTEIPEAADDLFADACRAMTGEKIE